jgi:hypothetical protein
MRRLEVEVRRSRQPISDAAECDPGRGEAAKVRPTRWFRHAWSRAVVSDRTSATLRRVVNHHAVRLAGTVGKRLAHRTAQAVSDH